MSFRSKRTNLTYVIESSHTDVRSRDKLDVMRTEDDDELAELLSRESHMTFRTCCIESKHLIGGGKMPTFLKQPVEACYSNIETSVGRSNDTFRISRSCQDGWREFDSPIDRMRHDHDIVPRISRGDTLLPEARKRDDDDEEEIFVHGVFSTSEISV
jgi:hypothetical protein